MPLLSCRRRRDPIAQCHMTHRIDSRLRGNDNGVMNSIEVRFKRYAGARGTVTPTSISRDNNPASFSSLHPSVPCGRIGTTR